MVQLMSSPQHIGDLIIPQPSGHLDTWTSTPASVVMLPWTRSLPQPAHFIPATPMPHFAHT